jgi:hypothetical protein
MRTSRVKLHDIQPADLYRRLPKGFVRAPKPLHTLRLHQMGPAKPTVTPLEAEATFGLSFARTVNVQGHKDLDPVWAKSSEWLFDLFRTGYYGIKEPGKSFRCIHVDTRRPPLPDWIGTAHFTFLVLNIPGVPFHDQQMRHIASSC